MELSGEGCLGWVIISHPPPSDGTQESVLQDRLAEAEEKGRRKPWIEAKVTVTGLWGVTLWPELCLTQAFGYL